MLRFSSLSSERLRQVFVRLWLGFLILVNTLSASSVMVLGFLNRCISGTLLAMRGDWMDPIVRYMAVLVLKPKTKSVLYSVLVYSH